MEAETLLITFLVFLTVAVLGAFAASRFRVPYTIAMVLVGLGVSVLHLSRTLELMRSPSTMDWILMAELRESLDTLPPEEPITEEE